MFGFSARCEPSGAPSSQLSAPPGAPGSPSVTTFRLADRHWRRNTIGTNALDTMLGLLTFIAWDALTPTQAVMLMAAVVYLVHHAVAQELDSALLPLGP